MKKPQFLLIFIGLLLSACQPSAEQAKTDESATVPTATNTPDPAKHPYLVLLTQENAEGDETYGYASPTGEVVIPMGKYAMAFTDTLRSFGIVMTKAGKPVAIDPQGTELYEVYWYDNGPDYPADGLFRIIKDGKVGYADLDGNIVITPQYTCTNPFENGKAKVAIDCKLVPSGEYEIMESDSWFYINTKGEKVEG